MSAAATFRGASPTRAAWMALHNQMHWWGWSLLALLFLGFPALCLFKSVNFALGCLVGIAGAGVVGLWAQLAASTQHQNHPTLARLLPSQPRRLRQNLVLAFLVLSAIAYLAGMYLGAPSFPVWTAAGLVYIAYGIRWPSLWAGSALFGFLPLAPRFVSAPILELGTQLFAALGTPLGLGCLLTAGAVMLSSLVRDGGTDHQSSYQKLQRRRRDFKATMDGDAPQIGWFTSLSRFGYGRSFDKAIERAAAGRPGFEREILALGPQAHLFSMITGVLVLIVIVCLVLIVLRMAGIFEYGDQVGQGIANSLFGLLGTTVGGVTALRGSLMKRRHEQALVSMLPGVPRGQDFNRQLAKSLLRKYLALWAAGCVSMWILLGSIPGVGYALLAFSVTLLAGGLVLLRNWAKSSKLKGWWAFFTYFPLTVAAIAARFAMEKHVISVGQFLALAVVVLCLLYAWRWRVMTRSKMAWPTNRE